MFRYGLFGLDSWFVGGYITKLNHPRIFLFQTIQSVHVFLRLRVWGFVLCRQNHYKTVQNHFKTLQNHYKISFWNFLMDSAGRSLLDVFFFVTVACP